MSELHGSLLRGAKIKVIGVGGSGGNAINTMVKAGIDNVEFIVANTDIQALDTSIATRKIHLGKNSTRGLGAGANPDVGRRAALEDFTEISEALAGADLVFITAGMGGGTGTGAASVVARIAKELGALSVGVVTEPFHFEGKKRMIAAKVGIATLSESVDSLIVIPNQKLISTAGSTISVTEAFRRADEVLLNAVRGISDLINHTGLINCDFADIRTIMKNRGLALMGMGTGEGEHRAVLAATNAIFSPLLDDVSLQGATGIVVNISGSASLSIQEINEATSLIIETANENADVIFGTTIDESLGDKIQVTVIAAGIRKKNDGFQTQAPQARMVSDEAVAAPEAPLGPPSGAQSAKNELSQLSRARDMAKRLGLRDNGSNSTEAINTAHEFRTPSGIDIDGK